MVTSKQKTYEGGPASVQVDPIKEKAAAFAAAHSDKVHILTEAKLYGSHLHSRLLPSSRHLFLVESPTSRPKILSDYLDVVQQATSKLEGGLLGHFLEDFKPVSPIRPVRLTWHFWLGVLNFPCPGGFFWCARARVLICSPTVPLAWRSFGRGKQFGQFSYLQGRCSIVWGAPSLWSSPRQHP